MIYNKYISNNKDSYTYKNYLRNKRILKIIDFIILSADIFSILWFIRAIQNKGLNLIGFIILLLVLNIAFIYTKWLAKQNSKYKRKNYNTWGKGAGAELIVEHELDKLPATYKVINDFNTGHGNIDHIILGPKGIFTIETKASEGTIQYEEQTIKINGKLTIKNYLVQTHAEVNYLQKLIELKFNKIYPITGILEFPHGQIDSSSIHGKIGGVWVGGNNFHRYAIERSTNQLSDMEIENIYKYLQGLKVDI